VYVDDDLLGRVRSSWARGENLAATIDDDSVRQSRDLQVTWSTRCEEVGIRSLRPQLKRKMTGVASGAQP
jgi:hypothetical protein